MSNTKKDNYPLWAKNAIWYQIFPDRFAKANPYNLLSAKYIQGTTPFSLNGFPWSLCSWNIDWYEWQDWELQNSKDLKTNILRRRFGGDIMGIISKLDYLKDLGVNALYITPMQFSPSLHKYDGTNFLHIDPFLGDNPTEDLKLIENENFFKTSQNQELAIWTNADRMALELIRIAHQKGFKVIFDGVFNHIGYNSYPFQDVLKNKNKSKFADWFIIDFSKKGEYEDFSYQKFWDCVREMPKLNYKNPDVQNYVLNTLKRWLCPKVDGKFVEGIDGWRIDHAIGVPKKFWQKAKNFVKNLNSEFLFMAELIEPEKIVTEYLNDDCFDSVMNYHFMYAVLNYFSGNRKSFSTKKFANRLNELLKENEINCNLAKLNLIGSHDTERILSYIKNRKLKKFDDEIVFWQNSHALDQGYNINKPGKEDILIFRMIVAFQFCFVGAPMIYYGDELGMWGAGDPDNRKPMIWDEIKFENQIFNAFGKKESKGQSVKADKEIFEFYQKIIAIRKNNKALSLGDFQIIEADDKNKILIFERKFENEKIICIFNRSKEDFLINLKEKFGKDSLLDCFSNKSFTEKCLVNKMDFLILK